MNTDDISGVQYQIVKIAVGGLDSASLVTTSAPLPAAPPVTTVANYGAVTVTSTATSIRGVNSSRVGLTIQNLGAVDLYWASNSSVTTSNGIKVSPGETLEIDARYTGAIFGITPSSTANIRYWEVG